MQILKQSLLLPLSVLREERKKPPQSLTLESAFNLRAYMPREHMAQKLWEVPLPDDRSSPKLCPLSQESNSTVDWTLGVDFLHC